MRKAAISSAEASLPPVTMFVLHVPSQSMYVRGAMARGFTHQPAGPTWDLDAFVQWLRGLQTSMRGGQIMLIFGASRGRR